MFAWVHARLWPALRAAVCNWIRDDGFLLSAALAYYASVSLFPICLVLFAGLGSFLAVMLWIYYASAVVLLGAEFVRVLDTGIVIRRASHFRSAAPGPG